MKIKIKLEYLQYKNMVIKSSKRDLKFSLNKLY